MATVMKVSDFVEKLKNIATKYDTLYVMGCIGAPMTSANKHKYIDHHVYNQSPTRVKLINKASSDTFGFDCVCLIKSVLWGWNGDKTKSYGGAKYNSKGVPDINADGMIKICNDVKTDFSNIEVGEIVWTNGHVGVYIGEGLVVECSPAWKNKVQITACNVAKSGYNTRKWKKHGKLPYIDYDETKETKETTVKKSITVIAREVIDGKWYAGAARKSALTKAGYDYDEVQKQVNKLLKKKSINTIAREVIQGKWGVGKDRKNRLVKAGYDYDAIQKKVNELL